MSFNPDGKAVRWLIEQGDWAMAGEAPSLNQGREAVRAVMFERIDQVFPF